MNETIQTILTRRSIRSFKEQPIAKEDLDLMIQAALHAPSGMGLQTWQFTVITNPEKIQSLAKAISSVLNRSGYDMYRPAALIIPSNQKDSHFGKEDDACALENIFLAAHSLGIGSVWINQLQGICDEPAVRAILKEFRIPDDHIVCGMAALGYAAAAPSEKERIGKVVFIQ